MAVPSYTLRLRWKVLLHKRFTAYAGTTTEARAVCLRDTIGKLQRGEIDIMKVLGLVDVRYSVWTCGVMIVAEIYDNTIVLIDVTELPDESV